MRVLVTGGTGFVGSHTVAALVAAGHDVRLLVRDADRVQRAMAPHHVAVAEVHVGDVTDRDSVRAAVAGCDAVVHGASVFSYDPREAPRIEAVNVRGTESVLGAASAAGCVRIIHVSSIVAFLPAPGQVVTEGSPVGTATTAYFRSKAESERIARGHQEAGAPVVITYPGGVIGPHDPYLQELSRVVVMILTYPLIPGVRGGALPIVDVRDVAEGHVAILADSGAPARYLLCGNHVLWNDLVTTLGRMTGRRLWLASSPAAVALWGARLADVLQRRVSRRLPVSYESVSAITAPARFDGDRAARALGVHPRALEESLRDTVRWLVNAGHLDASKAGRLTAALPA